jgi:signal transduction histidine kinase
MSQATSGKTRKRVGERDTDPSSGNRPVSTLSARARPETLIVELALSLAEAERPIDALREAVATLMAVLPECSVAIVESTDAQPPPASARQRAVAAPDQQDSESTSRARGAEKCEWPLTEAAGGPTLVIGLEHTRRPRDIARVVEIGERVALLVTATLRRHALQAELARMDTEVIELRQRVIQAEKLAGFGQFAAGVLHDLNSPLTAILAYSDYLARALGNTRLSEADLERIGRIRDAAASMLNQTRSLVEYARPPRAPSTTVELTVVIRRALTLCDHELTRAHMGVRLDVDPAITPVCGHFEQLTQLFVNLFANAAHAARPIGAELVITAALASDLEWITVTVSDNGSGIQSCDIARVFDPFYTTKGGSGTGLGLSIVRDIVRQHGAEISVQSTPGVETTFCLEFRAVAQACATDVTRRE